MRVVIDTNVVISAALKDRDPEAIVLCVVQRPALEWTASKEIIDEYIGVLQRPKFHLPDTIVQRWIDVFGRCITIINVPTSLDFPRDQTDAKFLACALAAKAEYLVTGDKDFSEAYNVASTRVLSVSLFKAQVCDV